MRCALLLLLAVAAPYGAAEMAKGCPLNKVIELLTKMGGKITAEGADADKIQTEKKEWCRTTKQDTEHSIERNQDAIEAASAALQKANAEIEAMSASISDLAASISSDSSDQEKSTALRKTQHEDFLSAQKDLEETVDQLVRAAGILRKAGLGGKALIQKALVQVVNSLSTVMDAAVIGAQSHAKLQAMLQTAQQAAEAEDDDGFENPTAAAYSSHSSAIIDMIAELKVKAEAELSDLRKEEMEKQHAYDLLNQGLTDSINTAERDRKNNAATLKQNEEIKGKSEGNVASEKNDLSTNQNFLADTTEECATADSDYEAAKKSRAEELAALAEAEKIIRGTYKGAVAELKAGGAAQEHADELNFLQVASGPRAEAVSIIKHLARKYRSLQLAQLAVRAGDDTFGKIKGLIRSMIDRLSKKAAEEADHNAYCVAERKESVAKRDGQQSKLDSFSARLSEANANEQTLKEDISALSAEVAELDTSMAEATKVRQEESANYGHVAEGLRIADDGLTKAIAVLKDYYASKGDHNKKTDSATGIIAMLETCVQDMANSAAQAESAETNASSAYEKMTQEGKVSKAEKSAAIKAKQGEVARLGELIGDLKSDVEGSGNELDATLSYLEKLKGMCEHKPQSFADRAAARQAEIEGLKQALDILENETAAFFLQRK